MNLRDFAVGVDHRYFEDYAPGKTVEYGPITVDHAEVIDFARRYDPQEFHVDPQRGRQTVRRLIASGRHTPSMMMRVLWSTTTCRAWRASARRASMSCAGWHRCVQATASMCASP